jgi:hypothetical protein
LLPAAAGCDTAASARAEAAARVMIFNMGCLAVGDEQIEESKSAARAPRGTRQG